MDPSIINLIISLISGAVGGDVAGTAVKDKSLGTPANTVLGVLGGGIGDFLMKVLGLLATTGAAGAATAVTDGSLDISSILANIGVGGVSGGALTAIVSLIKAAIKK